tara:strand:- start:462 stop:614 length:153 start_codon:yes stop_codon:yes gene_type:complete
MAKTSAAEPQSHIRTAARLAVEGAGCVALPGAAPTEAGEEEGGVAKLILP